MTEVLGLILDAAADVLNAHCTQRVLDDAQEGNYASALWDALEVTGITRALLPESKDGCGLSVVEAGALARVAAYHAAPVPLSETFVASWLLHKAHMEVPQGALSVAFVRMGDAGVVESIGNNWKVRTRAFAVPWARQASSIILLLEREADMIVAVLPRGSFSSTAGINLAGEPRETVEVDLVLPSDAASSISHVGFATVYEFGAALRTAQIAGALQRTLELSVSYTSQREQFGRALARFQAVQNNLAVLAGQVAAAAGAADLALSAATQVNGTMPIAAAKARASEAATVGAALAHQVHGAMGLTSEYVLHHYTQRLWSWRDEFGSEAYWWGRLGEAVMARGADHYWRTVCGTDDLATKLA